MHETIRLVFGWVMISVSCLMLFALLLTSKGFLHWLSDRRPARCIPIRNKAYLLRFHLFRVMGKDFYLHQFLCADAERWLHDHPHEYGLGIVLRGSYVQEWMTGMCPERGPIVTEQHLRRFGLNWIRGRDAHRIIRAEPGTWTLFIRSERKKEWGFYEVRDNVIVLDGEGDVEYQGRAVVYRQPFNSSATEDWAYRPETPKGRYLRERLRANDWKVGADTAESPA